ncbi:MAG: hypothetical protein JWN99_1373 [Ilumatobacteraceae bacterium]|nr:hypothetical protein [Ilumatobacteraceae bacterium]
MTVATTEIERRFLVDHVPGELGDGVRLRQGYVALDGSIAVRVRESGTSHVMTVKGGTGLSRTEVGCALDAAQFEALWLLTSSRQIVKTRHRIAVGEHTAELDVFDGSLSGLFIVEVEFESADDAAGFQPPEWFGREITLEPQWNNAALAVHGRPDRPE